MLCFCFFHSSSLSFFKSQKTTEKTKKHYLLRKPHNEVLEKALMTNDFFVIISAFALLWANFNDLTLCVMN